MLTLMLMLLLLLPLLLVMMIMMMQTGWVRKTCFIDVLEYTHSNKFRTIRNFIHFNPQHPKTTDGGEVGPKQLSGEQTSFVITTSVF